MVKNTRSFSLLFGRFVITANALSRLRLLDVYLALCRHACGHPGTVHLEHVPEKEGPFPSRLRQVSAWRDRRNAEFHIVTEPDLSVTRILLPQDLE